MALGTARGAPLKPKIKLSQVPSEYEAFLSPEQKSCSGQSPSEPIGVMALTDEVDYENARRKRRRTSNWCVAVEIIDRGCGYEHREHTGNLIAGTFQGAVKMIQLGSTLDT